MKSDAERLAERFKNVKNRAAFAREYGVPGKGAMIYQNMEGLKPISLEGAIAYATGFKCTIDDISPSVADKARKLIGLLAPHDPHQHGNVKRLPKRETRAEKLIAEICEIAKTMNERGQIELIGRAHELAKLHPSESERNRAK